MPRVVTLPSRWRFLGITDGGRSSTRSAGRSPRRSRSACSSPTSDGHDDHADWLVDYLAAVRIGMAATLKLPAGLDELDQLFVVGVQDSTPAIAAGRLFRRRCGRTRSPVGLAFLAPGTPTNNTPETRSDWSSRTAPRRPRPRPPALKEHTDAQRLATAFGLPAADVLAVLPRGGPEHHHRRPRAMAAFTWAAFTKRLVMDASLRIDLGDGFENLRSGRLRPAAPAPRSATCAAAACCRPSASATSRTACCPRRRSTSGIPPTTSSARRSLLPWLLRLRHHWRAALAPGWIPRVSDGRPADRTSVDALVRLPVAQDLVIRRIMSHVETTMDVRPAEPPGARAGDLRRAGSTSTTPCAGPPRPRSPATRRGRRTPRHRTSARWTSGWSRTPSGTSGCWSAAPRSTPTRWRSWTVGCGRAPTPTAGSKRGLPRAGDHLRGLPARSQPGCSGCSTWPTGPTTRALATRTT